MATHVDTAGRGDDFSATAHCSACGWSRTFVLSDDGSFETAVTAAESAAALHAAAAARLAADAFDTDNERFGPQT
jgi:hypothetical protein